MALFYSHSPTGKVCAERPPAQTPMSTILYSSHVLVEHATREAKARKLGARFRFEPLTVETAGVHGKPTERSYLRSAEVLLRPPGQSRETI